MQASQAPTKLGREGAEGRPGKDTSGFLSSWKGQPASHLPVCSSSLGAQPSLELGLGGAGAVPKCRNWRRGPAANSWVHPPHSRLHPSPGSSSGPRSQASRVLISSPRAATGPPKEGRGHSRLQGGLTPGPAELSQCAQINCVSAQ